jgi:hypothetical protein
MPTLVYKGANRISDESLVGKTIQSLIQDDVIVENLNLDGREGIKVNGQSQSPSYIIKSGDAVEFYKSQGTKGLQKDPPDEQQTDETADDDDEDDDDDENVVEV